jgi:hypothetical protein
MKKLVLLLALLGSAGTLFAQDRVEDGKYLVSDSVLIHTPQGHTLSAVVVRPKDVSRALPAALEFYLYSNTQASIREAKSAADHGYVGVVADVRGKRLSPDILLPYENEQEDVYQVIDWIARQPWCNGKVGMYGGSYSGFAQWAGLKHRLHPALKTIVPYVAGIPGQGLPMENNVFISPNYQWAFYVSNNKYTDTAANNDQARWQKMNNNWFASGAPYRRIDSVDGTPNPLLQRWLLHPSYDSYWQAMVPYRGDFKHIHIPVLAFDGYYNDGQCSSLHYLREHTRYDLKADDYLVIGPYDHFGAQQGNVPVMRGYRVDPVALIDVREMTFAWLDHILKGAPKPKFLRDHINYEVMASNQWQYAPSLAKMANSQLKLYFTPVKADDFYTLTKAPVKKERFIGQQVDMQARTPQYFYNYPDPIIQKTLSLSGGLAFISEPFKEQATLSGNFTGMIRAAINKKDMDYSLAFYEVFPDGRYFQFSYYLARASYSRDPSRRHLLTPGKLTEIPFSNTKITAKEIYPGSRILVVLNVNKNKLSEVNYGSGKTVSAESARDAGEPLRVKWYSGSYIRVPLFKQPYVFPLTRGWTQERTGLPPAFSPNVPYRGVEEIHFPPGWNDSTKSSYWTVSYLFRLAGKPGVNTTMLNSLLDTYFNGLIADNARRRHIPAEKLVAVNAHVSPQKKMPGDYATYSGSIRSLDYFKQLPIVLNCRIHLKPSAAATPLLIEISLQGFEQPIWQTMEGTTKVYKDKSVY